MKILVLLALLGATVQALTIHEIALISEGIIFGALDQEGLGDLTTCLQDAGVIGEHVYAAVKDFEKELAKHGLSSKMDKAYEAELEGTGGKSLATEEKEHA